MTETANAANEHDDESNDERSNADVQADGGADVRADEPAGEHGKPGADARAGSKDAAKDVAKNALKGTAAATLATKEKLRIFFSSARKKSGIATAAAWVALSAFFVRSGESAVKHGKVLHGKIQTAGGRMRELFRALQLALRAKVSSQFGEKAREEREHVREERAQMRSVERKARRQERVERDAARAREPIVIGAPFDTQTLAWTTIFGVLLALVAFWFGVVNPVRGLAPSEPDWRWWWLGAAASLVAPLGWLLYSIRKSGKLGAHKNAVALWCIVVLVLFTADFTLLHWARSRVTVGTVQ